MTAVELLGLGALAVLLAVAFLHPPPWVELLTGLVAAGLVLGPGRLPWSTAGTTVDRLLPVVLFLGSSLVVADVCAAEGVFDYLGAVVRRIGRADSRHLLRVTAVIAALVTAVLSLDATVVMLTPVVLAAAASPPQGRPLTHVCVRMANSASLLLPVSNLTNLLALPDTGLGFVRWAAVMAVPWVAVVLVEYLGVRVFFRADLRHPSRVGPRSDRPPSVRVDGDPGQPGPPLPVFACSVLVVMLAGFAIASARGIQPFWVSAAAAAVLGGHALRRRTVSPVRLAGAAQVPFAVFVMALGLVVAATSHPFLDDVVRSALDAMGVSPGTRGGALSIGLGDLLLLVALSTALANLVNNLPATLLLLPVVAPWGTLPTLTMLIGVNVGAGLTYPGSLANLLWRRVLVRAGVPPSATTFHLQAAAVVPVALVVAVSVLWSEAALGWW
ncbi:MAG: arsenical pump rane protein [Nocardioidaceae bacterium]|nr:arsenical pump rane protein [Nocardioidaceae bacterium]